MGRKSVLQYRSVFAVVLLVVTALTLSSCSWPWARPAADSTGAVPSTKVDVSFPGADPSLKAASTPIQTTPDMISAAPAGATVDQSVDLKMTKGDFPSTGAQASFTLDQPLAADHVGTIAYWNEQSGEWEVRPTDMSEDRRTFTAPLEHFSKYSLIDKIYNGIGKVMTEKTSPPTCPGAAPSWSQTNFLDDINGPVLWCVGTDAKNPDIMEVHLKMNRSSAGSIRTGIKPAWAWSDLFEDVAPITWTQMAGGQVGASNELGDEYLIQPLGEYRFGFNRVDLLTFWHDHQNQPLIEVGSSMTYAVAGLMYQAVDSKANGGLAGVFVMTSLLQCGGDMSSAVKSGSVASTFGAAVSCMASRKDAIAVATARAWSNMHPGADLDAAKLAGQNIGKAVRFAGNLYAISKATLSIGAILGDLTLDPISRQLNFLPSTDELKRYLTTLGPKLSTFSGAGAHIKFSFKYPEGWAVTKTPQSSEDYAGWTVKNPAGTTMATLNLATSVDFSPCGYVPYHQLDSTPVTIPGIDTSKAPTTVRGETFERRATTSLGISSSAPDGKPVLLKISLYGGPGAKASDTTADCYLTGVFHAGEAYGFFFSTHDFATVADAKAYAADPEYKQIEDMMASFRIG